MYPNPPDNGALDRIYNILKYWNEEDEITLISFVDEKHNPDCFPINRKNIRLSYIGFPKRTKNQIGLRCIAERMPYDVIQTESQDFRNLLGSFNNEKFDLSYCHIWGMSQYIDWLSGFRVLDTQNEMTMWWKRSAQYEPSVPYRFFSYFMYITQQSYERKILNSIDALVSVSEIDMLNTQIYGQKKINWLVAPNGVDIRYFKPVDLETKNNTIVFCGSLGVRMNEAAVLYFYKDIFPLIRNKIPNIHFMIIGRDPTKQILHLNDDPNVKVVGSVSDVRSYIGEAQVVIAPFKLGGGTKLKILHAMSMGKAIVTTSIGCQGISLQNGQQAFIADTPHDFANATIRLIESSQERDYLGKNARIFVESNYRWEIIVENLVDSLHQLVSNNY